jgi:adenosylcobinamide hydrolase
VTFEVRVADGVLQVRRSATRWLSTGWNGGFTEADAAYNLTVPEGWSRTDLDEYLQHRRDQAKFDIDGPALLTGVEMQHAKGARLDSIVAIATVGLSNPAALPMNPETESASETHGAPDTVGTVNLLVGTTQPVTDAALANLLAVVVEAKTATLLSVSGFPGTTTDAVIVGSAEGENREPFSGSATAVGSAARACVRDAVHASFRSRYADRSVPGSVADADHGVVTDRHADVFEPR